MVQGLRWRIKDQSKRQELEQTMINLSQTLKIHHIYCFQLYCCAHDQMTRDRVYKQCKKLEIRMIKAEDVLTNIEEATRALFYVEKRNTLLAISELFIGRGGSSLNEVRLCI